LSAAEILDAQSELLSAQAAHEKSESAHEDTMTCYEFGGQEHCPTLGTYEEMARAQVEAAYAGLLAAQAQVELEETRVGPQAAAADAAVQAELARRDAVEAELNRVQAGAHPAEIEVGEAAVRQAEATLALAQERLAQHQVEAPFDATVTDLQVDPGDTVAQGAPLATLATLDRLEIESTDLTEFDVTAIAVGRPVIVTFDAMPDQQLAGTVVRIDPQGAMQFGDILYTVTVELDNTPAWVRWGMSVQLEIAAVQP
jgi:HlyD family secretion protein